MIICHSIKIHKFSYFIARVWILHTSETFHRRWAFIVWLLRAPKCTENCLRLLMSAVCEFEYVSILGKSPAFKCKWEKSHKLVIIQIHRAKGWWKQKQIVYWFGRVFNWSQWTFRKSVHAKVQRFFVSQWVLQFFFIPHYFCFKRCHFLVSKHGHWAHRLESGIIP